MADVCPIKRALSLPPLVDGGGAKIAQRGASIPCRGFGIVADCLYAAESGG